MWQGAGIVKLVDSSVAPSPERDGCLRAAAAIAADRGGAVHEIWFDIPARYGDAISRAGNPWLVLMLPPAMAAGEDIALPLPVDPHLAENLRGRMHFWHAAFPELRPAGIDAPLLEDAAQPGARRAMFFSGGVDSTFTLLRHDRSAAGCGGGPVDDLLFVAGFGIPLADRAETELAGRHLARVAAAHGKELVQVFANLRGLDTAYRRNWLLFYGCALGALGHLLDRRYGEIVISAGLGYADRPVTGSHPVTDPLLGSRRLRFVQDGSSFTRLEKTRAIAEAGAPLAALRVCWEGRRHDNCSRCRKCLLTMATLDLLGFRGRAPSFDWSGYDPVALARVFVHSEVQDIFFGEVLAEAGRRGRADIAAPVAAALRRSRRARAVLARTSRLPFLWRFEHQIGRAFLGRQG
ncbi:MAG: hypothetical protein BroJett029_41770 [Alphaproteobacteria bacterium]|nr:MAG: hypothetical protein BroJett029_41770 [Alphaproteobacteria bacterium]